MNKDDLNKLAASLMFEISEDETNIIDKEFQLFLNQIKQINKIDTTDVKPLDYPFEQAIGELREDVAGEVLSVEDVLSNASETKNQMVVIPKVVL